MLPYLFDNSCLTITSFFFDSLCNLPIVVVYLDNIESNVSCCNITM